MEGLLYAITSFNNFRYVPVSGWQIYFAHFNSNSLMLEFVIQKIKYKGCFSDFLQNSATTMMIFYTLTSTNYVSAYKNLPVVSMGLGVLQLSFSKKEHKS